MLVFHRFSRYGAGVFLAASVSLTAFDLTLKTGEILSGVSITGVSPQGIRLRWDGGETRFIRYDALSPASLKTISDFTPLPAEGTAAADENREPPILPDTVGTVYFHSVRCLRTNLADLSPRLGCHLRHLLHSRCATVRTMAP